MTRLANRTKCEICHKQWAMQSLFVRLQGRDREISRCKHCGFTPNIGKGGFLEEVGNGYNFEPLSRKTIAQENP